MHNKYNRYYFGAFRISVYFIYTPSDWSKFFREKGCPTAWHPNGEFVGRECYGRCGNGEKLIVVLINPLAHRQFGMIELINTVVHECHHALEHVYDHIGAKGQSGEVAAHQLAAMVDWALHCLPKKYRPIYALGS
jgi:hypothetical protein